MLSLSLKDIRHLRERKKLHIVSLSSINNDLITASANEIIIITKCTYDAGADKNTALGIKWSRDSLERYIARFSTRLVNYNEIVILYPGDTFTLYQSAPPGTIHCSFEYFSIPADTDDDDDKDIKFKKRLWG